ncbi:protoporphyrinogen oxidase [Aquipuribacter sp. SD81]|uniref:protoporphyrinogen oxidase n=1 Tax=Aquipuribacter sp. SD81 TaxID=3127703 RepID=UPI00301ACE63
MSRSRVAVLGGGVSGLVAALDLVDAGADVKVLEARPDPGGLLRRQPVGGVDLDVGVEAFLARRPEGVALVERLGLTHRLTSPTAAAAAVWRRDGVRRLPRGTVLGVPGHGTDLSGVLRPAELAETEAALRAAAGGGRRDRPKGGRRDDVAVATAVVGEVGRPVLDVLVEPLLGGVHAGRTDELSLRSVVPQLWRAWQDGTPFADAVDAMGSAATPGAPVFTGVDGGTSLLADAAVDALRRAGARVRTGALVHGLEREGAGWRVRLPEEALDVDAVVVALPLTAAARLLRPVVPAAAALLEQVPVVGVGVVALAVEGDVPERSGLLVPPSEAAAAGVQAKAVTFSTRKWAWLAERAAGRHLVRVSYGRRGDAGALRRDDADLVDLAARDLATLLAVDDVPAPRVVDATVARWGGALPQHTVGHVDRVAAVRRLVVEQPGLAVAGGWTDGVGVPACIASGARAAAALTP